ncbi:hypothetical protein NWI01_13110 [Nitrobacter winogradskyi]|uniref:Uncharacterized protein n=1 Tax=Nitrobacter winogradskyi TaxID=913 RepID=A0A4Y3WC28_NITWI|nr:hypothetical protein NWI01_13110 [Nitrobacter winogradskyi]
MPRVEAKRKEWGALPQRRANSNPINETAPKTNHGQRLRQNELPRLQLADSAIREAPNDNFVSCPSWVTCSRTRENRRDSYTVAAGKRKR